LTIMDPLLLLPAIGFLIPGIYFMYSVKGIRAASYWWKHSLWHVCIGISDLLFTMISFRSSPTRKMHWDNPSNSVWNEASKLFSSWFDPTKKKKSKHGY
jgi:hypothetical protein